MLLVPSHYIWNAFFINVMEFQELIKQIPDIFEEVKRDVENVIHRHRAGLTLGLAEMGYSNNGFIGGMYFSGGTMILLNITALRILHAEQSHSEDILIAYLYHVLLHEYVHSLGFLNERICQQVTLHITKKRYKSEDHPAFIMASQGINVFFHGFRHVSANFHIKPSMRIQMVRDFDKSSITYFS